MTEADALFERARSGNQVAFAEWAGRVERPVRASLWRFARNVDLEVVIQETLLRMWVLATRTNKTLEGENASLRMALAVARNVAHEELRRSKRDTHLPLDGLENTLELMVEPTPVPDPGLARAIQDCFDRVPGRPKAALLMRIQQGPRRPDRELAEALGLKLNTFLQHIVRARRSMADCLRRKGVEFARAVP